MLLTLEHLTDIWYRYGRIYLSWPRILACWCWYYSQIINIFSLSKDNVYSFQCLHSMLVYFFTVRLPYIAGNRVDKKTRFCDFADIFAKIYVPFGEHCMKIRNFFGTKFKKFRKIFFCGNFSREIRGIGCVYPVAGRIKAKWLLLY